MSESPHECACGSGKDRAACCGPYLEGRATPPTAEALMRSRYAAFVEADLDYIRDTLHPGSRKDHDERATRNWATRSQWLGLEIRATDRGGEGDADGVVEFVARYRYKGEVVSHHERARFVKEDGRWWFVDSETPATEPVVRESPRVGRNEACPCGSGRKHKKCCGT